MPHSFFHICVDMQRMFAEPTPWHAPWMDRVTPAITALAEAHAEQTVFTRFVPPSTPTEASGAWRHYYEHWKTMTRAELPAELIELVAPLRRLVPPAHVMDKAVYSPWICTGLDRSLKRRGVETIVVTGGETEVCVLATVLGAIDLGYRVILPVDALCSSADETHDAMLRIYSSRYGMQVTTTTIETLLLEWNA